MIEHFIEALKTFSPIIAAIVSGCFLMFVNKHRKLKEKLYQAYKDIQFLQNVEQVHVEMTIGRGEKDNKVKVRNIVRQEKGFELSGKTPSEINRIISNFRI